MKKIPSFTIDHLTLDRGLYVSRKDSVGDEIVTTFDVRLKAPNREPAMDPAAMHTIEHLAATILRNHPVWAERVIYWGPMGCQTGFYLLVRGDDHERVLNILRWALEKTIDHDGEVFGASRKECGNYLSLNLSAAKRECAQYLEAIRGWTAEMLEYPKGE
jgi:S-ribosylhomocysteine lyase